MSTSILLRNVSAARESAVSRFLPVTLQIVSKINIPVSKLNIAIVLVLFQVILSGCKGESTSEESRYFDGYDLGGDESFVYQGSTTQAKITAQNAYRFLKIGLQYTEQLASTWRCNTGEVSVITDDQDEYGVGARLLEYSRCKSDNYYVDGRVLEKDYGNGNKELYFNSLYASYPSGDQIGLSGNIKIEGQSGFRCSEENRKNFNIVVRDLVSENITKLEDFVVSHSCENAYENLVNGRVYASDFGYADITTITPFEDLFSSPTTNEFSPSYTVGTIKVVGRSGSVATLELVTQELYVDGIIDYPLNSIFLSVDSEGDGEPNSVGRFTVFQFYHGVGEDLSDSDGDGMIDSWEVFYGLDPLDGSDAELDMDNDGYSNAIEYAYLGNPEKGYLRPLVIDLSLQLDVFNDNIRAGNEYTLSANVKNLSADFGATNVVVNIVKPENVEWQSHRCSTIGEHEIACNLHGIRERSTVGTSITVISNSVGESQFSATVSSSFFDPETANNTSIASTNIEAKSVDLDLTFNTYSDHEYAIIGEEASYWINVHNYGPDDVENAVLRLDIPNNLEIPPLRTGIGQCQNELALVCDLGPIPSQKSSSMKITVIGKQEGVAELTYEVSSDEREADISNNTETIKTIVGKSFSTIQSEIDNSNEGETIVVNEGLYVGKLSLRNGIKLKSETGPDNTTFWLSTALWMGDNTSLTGFTLDGKEPIKASTAENITISENIFLADKKSINLHSSSGEIFNNYFVDGCGQISVGWNSSFNIYNNIFYGNVSDSDLYDCTVVSLHGFINEGQNTNIINNTFVENDIAVFITKTNDEATRINVANNIFLDNKAGIHLSTDTVYGLLEPSIFNNILFNNEENYVNVSSAFLVDNIESDPLLHMLDKGIYRIGEGSPAIDLGNLELAPVFDFDGRSRPVDGNFDGVKAPDIGAVEFNPSNL